MMAGGLAGLKRAGWAPSNVVAKGLTGVDDGVHDLILAARRRGIGPVIMEVSRGGGHHDVATGIGRRQGDFHGRGRGIVRQVDDEVVCGLHVEGRILEALRRHEAK